MPTAVRHRIPVLAGTAALLGTSLLALPPAAATASDVPGRIVAWGNDDGGQTTLPADLVGATDVVAVDAGLLHSLALREDGTVEAWGTIADGEVENQVAVPATVPPDLDDVTAIAAGGSHDLALHPDGTVTAWGWDGYGQTEVPEGLTGVVAVDAGLLHSLAVRDDGTVVMWGGDGFDALGLPEDLDDVVGVAAGALHSLALRDDGTVVGWGLVQHPENQVGPVPVPAGLDDVVAVAAGYSFDVALHEDGTVTAWGYVQSADDYVEATVPDGLADVVAISANGNQAVALGEDGTVTVWGYDATGGPLDEPVGVAGATAVAAGALHGLAILEVPLSPEEQLADLRADLATMGVHHGVTNALDAKLRAADSALERGDTDAACDPLGAFLDQVAAETGKKLTADQAEQLADAATATRDDLGC